MENQTAFTRVPSISLDCVKNENDSELGASVTRSNESSQSRTRAEKHHRKFLKLACKTEKGLEWVTATTTPMGLSIGLVVGDENHEEELVESNAITDDLLNENESEWFGSCLDESGPAIEGKSESQDGEDQQGDELFRFIFTKPTAPVNGVFRLREWYTGKYKYVDKNSSIVKTVLDLVKLKYCELSIEEIYGHINSCDQMYYVATFENFSEYYYSIERSVDELENVLLYQYDKNKDSIKSFLKNLYDVLNKNLPKINTFSVYSDQQFSGKRFFFDAVVHYCVNYGQLGNFNAFSRFPFQDCIDRRVLLWNDPNVEPSAWKTLQLLFSGDPINVKVNDLDDHTVIGRTPIIVLSRHNVVPKYEPYRVRFTYPWKGNYPCLKDLEKKPLPLAIYHLFKKYDIILSTDTVLSNNEGTVDCE